MIPAVRTAAGIGLLAVSLVAGGCVSARRPPAQPGRRFVEELKHIPIGSVMSVNRDCGYVVLECVLLPSPGTQVKVYRGMEEVAELRIGERRAGALVTAEILGGDPRKGDLVRRVADTGEGEKQ